LSGDGVVVRIVGSTLIVIVGRGFAAETVTLGVIVDEGKFSDDDDDAPVVIVSVLVCSGMVGDTSDIVWLHVVEAEVDAAGTVIVIVSFSWDIEVEHEVLL
jgi:hypothetical protein